jgi:hypothetical protein
VGAAAGRRQGRLRRGNSRRDRAIAGAGKAAGRGRACLRRWRGRGRHGAREVNSPTGWNVHRQPSKHCLSVTNAPICYYFVLWP